ncbi:MAG: N-acetyl-gamma-glutamyl-phosphate reductase [Desulfonauticus sp.]|jgi:N-acetyl-gamma-glutamyl-phosphate reductase|nr:MAG: N-acetyl-gamma-glutamyl-phosphate reductase [Desulfonauticus sp. 38_4375]MDK2921404.1 N-acetyl-gamma-glutamyl-phosphate reductase [Desulfonauticus sp.]
MQKTKVGIIGVSGYTGIELLRLLENHAGFELVEVTSRKLAGKAVQEVFPFVSKYAELMITDLEQSNLEAELYFLALPHGTAMQVAKKLLEQGKKVVDLSADFRLQDVKVYEQWYQVKHLAQEYLDKAVYGLPEIYAEEIKKASLIANPGCYPTSVILGLYPALKYDLIEPENLIIDSKSGTTGAGRSPKEATLFCEVYDNFYAYNLARHRHTPEIEQELSKACAKEVKVCFSTHLLPLNRGILSTIYADLKVDLQRVFEVYKDFYGSKKWVKVLPLGTLPQVRWVRGTFSCFIGLVEDKRTGKLIVVSAIDNLCRGASGQALANANLLCGYPLEMGLISTALVP